MRCVAFVVALDVFSVLMKCSFILSLGHFGFLSILPFVFWILNKSGLHVSGFAFRQCKRGRKLRVKFKLQLSKQNKVIIEKFILSIFFWWLVGSDWPCTNLGYSILHKLHSVPYSHCHSGGETRGFPEAQAQVQLCQVSQNKACLWQNQQGCCWARLNLEVILHNLL